MIDGIVITDFESRNDTINRLIKIGVEPRKIILWNNRGIIEPLTFQADDGTTVACMEGLQFHIRNQDDANFVGQMLGWLQAQRQFYSINPAQYREYVSLMYRQIMGKNLDWNNLQTWSEKMQWIKLYDSTPIKTRLADKFLVREWVAEKIGAEYLIPLLGVWNNFDEIDFDALPNQFVLKCNHGSGMNIICRDKNKFNYESAREKLTAWLAVAYGSLSMELYYNKIQRKILAEKFMTDGKNFDLVDYKFWCFDGKTTVIQCETDRTTDLRFDYFDMDFHHTNIERSDHKLSDHPENIAKPKNFELMKELAAELCKEFKFVRVDFYEIEGKVYFGEMTFIPGAAYIKWKSEGTDELFGDLMTLPNRKYKF